MKKLFFWLGVLLAIAVVFILVISVTGCASYETRLEVSGQDRQAQSQAQSEEQRSMQAKSQTTSSNLASAESSKVEVAPSSVVISETGKEITFTTGGAVADMGKEFNKVASNIESSIITALQKQLQEQAQAQEKQFKADVAAGTKGFTEIIMKYLVILAVIVLIIAALCVVFAYFYHKKQISPLHKTLDVLVHPKK